MLIKRRLEYNAVLLRTARQKYKRKARRIRAVESRDVTISIFSYLIRLLCAELVAGSHHDNFDAVEGAVRSRINIDIPGASPQALAEGIRRAHEVLTPVLLHVRAQAHAANIHDVTSAEENGENNKERRRLLMLN
jgi:hypothetical protein